MNEREEFFEIVKQLTPENVERLLAKAKELYEKDHAK